MKRISLISILIILIFTSCNRNKLSSDTVTVIWEVISNTFNEKQKSLQQFTIINNGQSTLTHKNWELFYNQTPRELIETADTAIFQIRHINGDWYSLRLKTGKVLKPGDSADVRFILSHWHIKETDAPKGPYSVYFNSSEKTEEIIPVTNFIIKPFDRPEQSARHRGDRLPMWTPEYQYTLNESMNISVVEELKSIVPSPFSTESSNSIISLDNSLTITAHEELNFESAYLKKQLEILTGTPFKNGFDEKDRAIILEIDNDLDGDEAYSLVINDKGIRISGKSKAGVFYGIQSLLGHIPVSYYKNPHTPIKLQSIRIMDKPRFGYRGLHLDVSRNFQSKEQVLEVLDIMAFYKLNALHFYITEDEGWRLEIRGLPELTKVGGYRAHTFDERESLHPAYGSGPFADPDLSYGSGYYTREDFKEILQYAHKRNIQVIPSINFPGHARAAVISMEARYKNYMEKGESEKASEFRLVHPKDTSDYQSVQYYTDNVVDVGLESTYLFFETVIADIVEQYQEADVPLKIIHTGGDEVPDGVWEGSPASIEKLAEQSTITEAKNLQQYFFNRISEIISKYGVTVGGWEEIVLTKDKTGNYIVNPEFVDKDVLPYVWNNLGSAFDLTHRMVNAGYPVVYCGVSHLYMDMAYNNSPYEPGYYWGGFVNERKVWELSPIDLFASTTHDALGNPIEEVIDISAMEGLKPEAMDNIIGLQAELWSESIKGGEMLEYYLLPKLISFAERAWAKPAIWEEIADPQKRGNLMNDHWNIFANSLTRRELPRLNYLFQGYNYRMPAPGAVIINDTIYANHEYPNARLYYTTDGTEPNLTSFLYKRPIAKNGVVKFIAVDTEGKFSRTILLP